MDYKDEIDYATRTPAAPVPASTGRDDFEDIAFRFFKNLPFTYRKRMLQVLLGWDDKVMEQVRTHSDERHCLKRALKVSPVAAREPECPRCPKQTAYGLAHCSDCVAARELDVGAERLGGHPLWVKMQRLTRYRHCTSGMLSAPSGGFYSATDVQAMIAEFVAARSAAQSTAPVSTEQAGDATFEYRADAEDIWHKAPLAELEQIASDGFQVRAPSPNNSPAGGKGEQ